MPAQHGMVFILGEPRQQSFWMKNTRIPLDLLYLTADGVVREIHSLYPYNLNGVSSKRKDIVYAVELNQGESAELGNCGRGCIEFGTIKSSD